VNVKDVQIWFLNIIVFIIYQVASMTVMQAFSSSSNHSDAMKKINDELRRLSEREKQRQEEEKY